MVLQTLLALLLLAAAAGARRDLAGLEVAPAIAGGDAAQLNRFRWMASLRQSEGPLKGDPFCGGVLINEKILLTAASCTQTQWNIPPEAFLFPQVNIDRAQRLNGEFFEKRRTKAIALHAQWDPEGADGGSSNDLALILLDRPSRMTPIRLPKRVDEPGFPKGLGVGSNLTVLGYGVWNKPNVPFYLQEATLQLFSQQTCKDVYGEFPLWAGYRGICAGAPRGKAGICAGDSGGPLFKKGKTVKQDMLVGIATFSGFKGCGKGEPSGFMNVVSYLEWINQGSKVLLSKRPNDPKKWKVYCSPEYFHSGKKCFA